MTAYLARRRSAAFRKLLQEARARRAMIRSTYFPDFLLTEAR